MKLKNLMRLLSMTFAFLMLFVFAGTTTAQVQAMLDISHKDIAAPVVTGAAANLPDPNEETLILVRVAGNAALRSEKNLENAVKLAPNLRKAQYNAVRSIEGKLGIAIEVIDSYTLLYNGFTFKGTYSMIDRINAIDGLFASVPMQFQTLGTPDEGAVTPSMGTATDTIGAEAAWELGYSGAGTAIAIIDTGIRKTHEAFSVMPENGKIDVDYLNDVITQYGSVMHSGTDATQLYANEKLPFNYDYFDNDYDPNHTASDHGTHVAGIAAGNNGTDFKGAAPDAQIVTMQVFANNGGAYFTTLLLAMEDCVCLGVDAINMSLGAPAGFSNAYTSVDGFAEALQALEDAGIAVAVAAGNEGNTLTWTNYGDYYTAKQRGLASNPDIGIIGSPASFLQPLSVASITNISADTGYMMIGDTTFYYSSGSSPDTANLGTIPGEHRMVYAGYGTREELAAVDVEGAIALVRRGNINYYNKVHWAAEAGAIGIIMFNNSAGSFSTSVVSPIPLGVLSLAEGEAVIATFDDGVNGVCEIIEGLSFGSLNMAQSSSWGTTADLLIKPEISAPGDGVSSSIGFGNDDSYAKWTGTSMATPQIAASIAIIKSHLRELFPNTTEAELNELAYSFAMSTAHPVKGFVRQQGAGLVDIASAIGTEVYLSVDNSSRPKLELGDSETGVFTFSFTVNNIGERAHTYAIMPSVLTDLVMEENYSGTWAKPETTSTVKLISGSVYDVTALAEITAPQTITVEANDTVVVTITIDCTGQILDYISENLASGAFIEGHVRLVEQDENGIDLSIPYLGFAGDWNYASMLDRGYYWMEKTGENNYQQLFTSDANYVGFRADQGLGLNTYADMSGQTYIADRNAISPNGDGILDDVTYLEYTLLRNPRAVKLLVEDAQGNVIQTLFDAEYALTKDYYISGLNGGDTYNNLQFDLNGSMLAENETVYLVLETWLDNDDYLPENNESGRWVIPVTKDTQAPAVIITDGGINIVDENYISYYAVYSDSRMKDCLYETGVFAEERGVISFYETDADKLYVKAADYAGNETVYEVDLTANLVADMDTTFTDFGRKIIGYQTDNFDEQIVEFGWVSFNSHVPAGTYQVLTEEGTQPISSGDMFSGEYDIMDAVTTPDGTVYACSWDGIFKINPETFERELAWDAFYSSDGDGYTLYATNLALEPQTNRLFCAFYSVNCPDMPDGTNIGTLDIESGKVTYISTIEEILWGMDFLAYDRLCYYDNEHSLIVMDGEWNVIETYDIPCYDQENNGSHLGIRGPTGSMLYDDIQNCIYLSSSWSWFGKNRYSSGGMFKYDFDTGAFTMYRLGNDKGRTVLGLFFADSASNAEPIALEEFELDVSEISMQLNQEVTINALCDPIDANQFTVEWTSDDPNIAAVSGGKRRATVVGVGFGETTVNCTVLIEGEIFYTSQVSVSVTADPELVAALNAEGSAINFSSSNPYPFITVQDGDRYYAESSNQGIGDSVSILNATIEMSAGDILAFDYYVSSEEDWDLFDFNVNGSNELNASGIENEAWQRYIFVAEEDGVYSFEWKYEKDSGYEEGNDSVRIDNVKHYAANDVNGDGVIDGMDALIVLRYSIEIISISPEALILADANGDSVVDLTDAIILLRRALTIL